jgi:class 3 adenylate cyclase
MAPWVVDPLVERYGMIYDISDFSATLSVLHRAGNESQEGAFLTMFRFQRRINRLAVSHRAKLEKYLGDGAFYSSREATNLLLCSIQLQRYYVEAVREGLPFDRGMRIALNFGPYRLIPMGGQAGEGERYEFFGPGLVELSRLTTGKATQEIDEVKTMLINQGYPEATVHRFFAPLSHKNVDVVDK